MANPWEFFSAERIAGATGCPIDNVRATWPLVVAQLELCGIADRPVQVAAIGTIAIETASTFLPVREAFYLGEPAAEDHRRTLPYYPWYGRGDIQLTHEDNYRSYGRKVDTLWKAGGAIDLIARPDDALNPDVSAAVLAVYFRDHGGDAMARIPAAARIGNWREVRRLVQGGSAGLDRLEKIAGLLGKATTDETGPTTSFKYTFPVEGYKGEVPLHWGSFPGGSDLFAPAGTPVRAIADGVVVFRQEWSSIGGNCVQIEHSNGDNLESYYAHGDRIPQVKMGERVKAGQFLFGVGESGNAAGKGAHLHFGMGEEILTGAGPSGGCGSNYDAVALLRGLLAATPPGGQTDVAALQAENAKLQQQVSDLTTALAEVCDVVADVHQGQVDKARAIREQFIGPRPAA